LGNASYCAETTSTVILEGACEQKLFGKIRQGRGFVAERTAVEMPNLQYIAPGKGVFDGFVVPVERVLDGERRLRLQRGSAGEYQKTGEKLILHKPSEHDLQDGEMHSLNLILIAARHPPHPFIQFEIRDSMVHGRGGGLPDTVCFLVKNNYREKLIFPRRTKNGLAHISTLHFPGSALHSPV
jgi:hypothetical protein